MKIIAIIPNIPTKIVKFIEYQLDKGLWDMLFEVIIFQRFFVIHKFHWSHYSFEIVDSHDVWEKWKRVNLSIHSFRKAFLDLQYFHF